MVSANHIDKEILTLGKKWQNFAVGKIRQHQSPAQSVFRQNINQKVTEFLRKWQIDSIAELPSLQLPLVANLHQKYFHSAHKFQHQQHQSSFSTRDTQEEDWWSDFDLLQQHSSLQSLLASTKDTLKSGVLPSESKLDSEPKSTNLMAEPLELSQQQEQIKVNRQIEQSSYSNINSQLRNFLGNILKLRIPQLKIYSNQVADNYARKLQADAVTYEDKILLRTDKNNLKNPENIALLGHELTHASSLIPQRQNHYTGHDNLVEEQTALSNEQKVLNYFSLPGAKIHYDRPSVLSGGISSINQNSNLTPTALPPPQKADSNRELNQSPTITPNLEISDSQIKMLKAEILQEMARQIREHYERGG